VQTREAARSLTASLRNQRWHGKRDLAAKSVLKQVFSLSIYSLSPSLTLRLLANPDLDPRRRRHDGRTDNFNLLSLSLCVYSRRRTAAASPCEIEVLSERIDLPDTDLGVAIPRAADLMESTGTAVHDGGNGLTGGLRNGLVGGLRAFFLFFNPLTEAGICKVPALVKHLTEAGKATATVVHGSTVTFGWSQLPLPASENKKCPPPLNLL
jgi:hypothetical protein